MAPVEAALKPWLNAHAKPAWRPVIAGRFAKMLNKLSARIRADEHVFPRGSTFGGDAWLPAGEAWPVCGECGSPLKLFLQLDLSALPLELGTRFGGGLLQVFHCADDQCLAEGWKPFAGGKLVPRVLNSDNARGGRFCSSSNAFPVNRIVGWQPYMDFPSDQEHDELGPVYTYVWGEGGFPDEQSRLNLSCSSLALAWENLPLDGAECLPMSSRGEKLAGWPYWVQNVEYPDCPICQQRMQLVFQLDSEDTIPFMFGDTGCGHVTQCPTHLDVVTFGWACS